MPRESAFRLVFRWLRGEGARTPDNGRLVAEAADDLDRAAEAPPDRRMRIARGALLQLERCGPFSDEAGYVRFLLACARAFSAAGTLADVPDFLRQGLARLRPDSEGAHQVQAVLDDLDPVADGIRSGRIQGPPLDDLTRAELARLHAALAAIPFRPGAA